MDIKVKVTLEMNDVREILTARGIESGGRVQRYIATQLVGMFDNYVPLRSGVLKGSATRNLASPYKEIIYDGPYAARMYYNPQYRFNEAPKRGGYWDKRAWADNSDNFIRNLQMFIDRGGSS